MQENNDSHLRITPEVDDLVRWTKEKGYVWMTVDAIEGDQAICTYRTLDHPLDEPERPTALIPQQGYFPLNELEIQRGHR
jgi:hypothetical protein